MARGGFSGFGSERSSIQFPYLNRAAGHFAAPSVQARVRATASLFLLIASAARLAGAALCAQTDDVHITPRVAKKTDVAAPDGYRPIPR